MRRHPNIAPLLHWPPLKFIDNSNLRILECCIIPYMYKEILANVMYTLP